MNAKLAKIAKGTTHAVLHDLRNFVIFVIAVVASKQPVDDT